MLDSDSEALYNKRKKVDQLEEEQAEWLKLNGEQTVYCCSINIEIRKPDSTSCVN
jgi:hypothetical protein